ncbi:hypothetical protein NA78x_002348 [Anatilimnocola sp. NA78]|uniref:capsular polysaccharide export protein, LipB/KpsS family n=1 Tax=Anatilimnocola sp. NA78 TaxID=3415683 RepID=UPI003CE52CDA
MANILVQIPFSARCLPAMRQIAHISRAEGHTTRYWLGPLSGWLPNRLWAGKPDLAFVWNGVKPRYLPSVRLLNQLGAKVVYVEHGWYPQAPTVQLDTVGVNVGASWSNKPLATRGRTPLPVRPQGDLLVLLQHDEDAQITEYSPWFANMAEFVEHVATHSTLPVRVRPHPRHPPSPALRQAVTSRGHAWDTSPSLSAALETCRAVACVNSGSAIEAFTRRVPVLCFGESIYRHPGVVYCLDHEIEPLRMATNELAQGQSSLFVEAIEAILERVHANQFRITELNQVLPVRINQWLETRPSAATEATRRSQRVIHKGDTILPMPHSRQTTPSAQPQGKRRAA